MELINADLSPTLLFELFKELHEISFTHKDDFNQVQIVERVVKCANVDVKITFRMYVTHVLDDDGLFTIIVKLTANSNSISLRKYKISIGDVEYFSVQHQIPKDVNDRQVIEHYTQLVEKVINGFNVFKVCKHCRILYKDLRTAIDPNQTCSNCMFDRVFHFRDMNCSICNDNIAPKDYNFTLTCGHTFHTECALRLFIRSKKRDCPLCREPDYHDQD